MDRFGMSLAALLLGTPRPGRSPSIKPRMFPVRTGQPLRTRRHPNGRQSTAGDTGQPHSLTLRPYRTLQKRLCDDPNVILTAIGNDRSIMIGGRHSGGNRSSLRNPRAG